MSTSSPGAGPPPSDRTGHPEQSSGKAPGDNQLQQDLPVVGGSAAQPEPSPCTKCPKCTAFSARGPVEQDAKDLEAATERDLFRLLHAQNVEGPVWASVVTTLAEYATQVLNPWIWTNEIYKQLHRKNLTLNASPAERRALTVDRGFRIEIVNRTVVAALEKFQERMRESRGWDPCRGLQLKVYFINTCLFVFPTVFESDLRWRRAHQLASEYDEITALADAQAMSRYQTGSDPIAVATERLAIEAYLATLSDIDRVIVLKVAEGYKQQEIVELFLDPSVTVKAVEHRLRRIRENAPRELRTYR